jgi:hypothetical protein
LGTGQSDTADGVFVVGEEDPSFAPGVHRILAERVVNTEANVGVVVMVSTLNANGATDAGRQFAFYCSRLYSSCVSVYGDSSEAFKPYTTVDIGQRTWRPSPAPSPLPSALPTLLPSPVPTPAPTTHDTVKVTFSFVLSGSAALDLIEVIFFS